MEKRKQTEEKKIALSDNKEAKFRDLITDWMWNEKERGSQEETHISALSKQVARTPCTVKWRKTFALRVHHHEQY